MGETENSRSGGQEENSGQHAARPILSTARSRKGYLAALVAVVVAVFIIASHVFLLFLACILFAILLSAVCKLIEARSSLPRKWSLTIVVSALLGLAALAGFLIGPQVAEQFNRFTEELPRAIEHARQSLASSRLGVKILEFTQGAEQNMSRAASGAITKASTALSSTVGVIVQFFVIFFVGLFLAGNPSLYLHGFGKLFPPEKRSRVGEILTVTGGMLERWLAGRFLLMASNGIVTALGLWLLGVPLALTLGFISAVLNFIPNFGPWAAAIPAVLIALLEGPAKAMYTALFYLGYQMFDGYVLTPLVQRRTASLPPALVLMSQVLFGVLFGAWGVILAVPLAAVIVVFLREVHVKDVWRT